jgi:Uma2 family endonuclease
MPVAELTPTQLEWAEDPEPFPVPPNADDLPYDDGEPLESNWHRLAMNQLIENVVSHWKDRRDVFAGGNMFVYFSTEMVFDKDFRGPDVFVVTGVRDDHLRKRWVSWNEGGKHPELIVELTSESTAKVDRVVKKDLYAKTLRCPEYYVVDPAARTIEGWELAGGEYVPILPVNGRYPSKLLGAHIGWWPGTYIGFRGEFPRLFDADGNLRPLFVEIAQAEAVAAQAEAVAAQAEAVAAQAEAVAAQAEAVAAQARAEQESARADTAEAELAALRAELDRIKNTPKP